MSKLKIFIIFSIISLFNSSNVFAESLDREYIQNFAKQFVEREIHSPSEGKMIVSVAALDPRISIKACSTPLSANIPEKHNGRNVNVKIFCNDTTPWYLFIPVKIETMIPVVVAKSVIEKGSRLTKSNVDIILQNTYKVRGEVTDDLSSVIGSRAKRKIMSGKAITRRNICLVCRGESVTIIAKSNDFVIKTQGVALRDGSIGDEVFIENTSSGRSVTGQVIAINKVVINL